MTAVIDLGDDTDTVAATTGAIAGAGAGVEQIPSRWQSLVHGQVPDQDGHVRRYDHSDLMQLSISLLGEG